MPHGNVGGWGCVPRRKSTIVQKGTTSARTRSAIAADLSRRCTPRSVTSPTRLRGRDYPNGTEMSAINPRPGLVTSADRITIAPFRVTRGQRLVSYALGRQRLQISRGMSAFAAGPEAANIALHSHL